VRRLVAATALIALAAPLPASAASSQDLAATHALITASYALGRATNASIPVAQAKIERLNAKLAAECPKAGAGTLENEASEPMTYEVVAALWVISYGNAAGPIKRFVSSVKSLHWSVSSFGRVLHTYTTNLLKLATLPMPDLCADVRAWTASGFTTVPREASELDRRVEPLSLPELPWKLLAPFETRHDASLIPFIKRAEVNVEEEEFRKGQDDYYKVLETLGLPP
jgi:hypothetical protein